MHVYRGSLQAVTAKWIVISFYDAIEADNFK